MDSATTKTREAGHRTCWTLVAAMLLSSCGTARTGDQRHEVATSVPARAVGELVGLPPAPLSDRFGQAITTVGGSVIVFGGRQASSSIRLADGGARYDVTSGRWHRLPQPPWEGDLLDPSVASDGDGFVVAGVRCLGPVTEDDDQLACFPGTLETARFDVASGSWTTIESPSKVGRNPMPSATVFTSGNRRHAYLAAGGDIYAYDRPGARWRSALEAAGPDTQVCAFDTSLTGIVTPDRLTDPAPLAGPSPDTSSIRALEVRADGSRHLVRNPFDLGPLPDWWLVACTSGGVLAVGITVGKPAYVLLFDPGRAKWIHVEPAGTVSGSALLPTGEGALLLGESSSALVGLGGGEAAWRPVALALAADEGAVAVLGSDFVVAAVQSPGVDHPSSRLVLARFS